MGESVIKWFCFILLCGLKCCQGQRAVGDYCVLRNGNRGVCTFLDDCSSVLATIETHKPVICGFFGNALIVCCGDNSNDRLPFTSSSEAGEDKRFPFDEPYRTRPYFSIDSTWKPPQNKPFRPTEDEPYSISGAQNNNERNPPSRSQHEDNQNKEHRYSTTPSQHRHDRIPVNTHQEVVIQGGKNRNPTTSHKYQSQGFQNGGDQNPSYNVNRPVSSLRKSQIKCKEYSQSVIHKVEALPLLPDPTPIEVEVARCDIRKLPLIVGGEKTLPGEFPHMAALGYQEDRNIVWHCGGSLISERYILTAAHCTLTSRGPPVIARLGELHLKRGDDGAQPRDYTISSVVRHPNYKAPAKYNDIALLKLSHNVQFNKFVRPACLFTEDDFPVNKTIAIGWGQIDYAEKQSDVLLKVALDIIDNDQCNHLYRSSAHTQALSQGIAASMMCAGILKGGKDTCHGDSGGPIQITSGQNKCIYYVIGVTSFGKFCAAENAPGVYTRVSEFVSWIEDHVWP